MGTSADKRSAAYESIFGRPSAAHHQYPRPPPSVSPNYAQGYQQLQPDYASQSQNYYYQQQQQQPYDPRYDAQSMYSQQQYAQQQAYAPSSYRQQPYHVQQMQQQQQQYIPYNNPQYSHLNPPDRYAGSLASSSRSAGVIVPQPSIQEAVDPSIEDLVRSGMTPAQAYQAHVYQNNQSLSQSTVPTELQPTRSTNAAPTESRPQRGGGASTKVAAADGSSGQVPVLGFEVPDGRLDLDFSVAASNLEGGKASGSNDVSRAGSAMAGASPGASQLSLTPSLSARSLTSSLASNSPQSFQESPYTDNPLDYQAVAGPSSRPYPLQLETARPGSGFAPENVSPASSTYPPSSTYVDHTYGSPNAAYTDATHTSPTPSSPRRSSESSKTLPRQLSFRKDRIQDRTRSMSATSIHGKSIFQQENNKGARPAMPSFNQNGNAPPSHHNSNNSHTRRTPIVYPALLSRVAEAFQERITLSERVKDGLAYKDAFDGREAVDKIAYIIKTTDRNLALLLGRALDAQKFFHDVSYEHRLRDSPYELFQFRTTMPTPFVSGGDVSTVHGHVVDPVRPMSKENVSSNEGSDRTGEGQPDDGSDANDDTVAAVDEAPLPSGVFTLLTDCYSPTCSRDSLCYSIACPRRLEQQARLNLKPQPGLKRSISKESLGDLVVRVDFTVTHERG